MRVIIAAMLIAVIAVDQVSAQERATNAATKKEEVAGFSSASLVEVSLNGGGQVRGHIVRRTDTEFTLEREKRAGTQNIAYEDVVSISRINGGHSKKKWIIIGVVAIVVVVVVIGAEYAKGVGSFNKY